MTDNFSFEMPEPKNVWQHFLAFTKIARPSGKEAEALGYISDWAMSHGFGTMNDSAGNLIVKVPGSDGYEDAPTVILQGHIDMVCERDSDSEYDASIGKMKIIRDGDYIKAVGTTLGADNGIGVAMAMAIADDGSTVHPPLELLITVDEETGLTGAQKLDGSLLDGRTLINIDSEEEGSIFVGCAGGCDTYFEFKGTLVSVPENFAGYEISVSGLKGGHSGLDIDKGRLNAVKLVATILKLSGTSNFLLKKIDGGNMRNAIPREASAVVYVPDGDTAKLMDAVKNSGENRAFEPEITFSCREIDRGKSDLVFDAESSHRLIVFLNEIPSGVIEMSRDIPGLVETSNNLGVVRTEGDSVKVVTCSRSSVMESLKSVLGELKKIADMYGVKSEHRGLYPGWKPNLESPVLAKLRAAYLSISGKDAEIKAIHAGLECGLIGEKIPGIDMVSFGPNIEGAHSPSERVSVGSVERTYEVLKKVMGMIAGANG